jgi:hypothetical protein
MSTFNSYGNCGSHKNIPIHELLGLKGDTVKDN